MIEGFTNDNVEGFIPGVKIPSPMDILKDAFNFLIKPVWDGVMFVLGDFIKIMKSLITLITNPAKLIEFFVRLMLFAILIVIVVLYAIKIAKDLTLGESILYLFFLLLVTAICVSMYIVLFVIVYIIKQIDTTWPVNGKLYPFFYRFFGADENIPDAWYMNGSYHRGNRNERIWFFSYSKCSPQYIPNNKMNRMLCSRIPNYEPRFCPEANIYRMYASDAERNLSIFKPYVPQYFNPDMNFINSSKPHRRKVIEQYKYDKNKFFQDCNLSMQPYHSTARNICRNIHTLDIQNDKRKELEKACSQYFCHNGAREPFCFKSNYIIQKNNDLTKPKTLAQRIIFAFVFTLCLMIITSVIVKYITPTAE